MKTFTKFLALGAAVLGLAAGLYESRAIARQAADLGRRRQRLTETQRTLAQLEQERGVMRRDLAQAEEDSGAREAEAAAERELGLTPQSEEWLAKFKELKRAFELRPDQAIPEMQQLTELDWLGVARRIPMDPENDYRSARAKLREWAKYKFASRLSSALLAFEDANHGMVPGDLSLLQPYLDGPVDPATMARYEVHATGKASDLRRTKVIVERAPIDAEFDSRMEIQPTGGFGGEPWKGSGVIDDMQQAFARLKAARPDGPSDHAADVLPFLQTPSAFSLMTGLAEFQRLHNGREPNDLTELRPYVTSPEGRAELERLIKQKKESP